MHQTKQTGFYQQRHDRADGDGPSREGYVASLQLMLFGCIRAMERTELKNDLRCAPEMRGLREDREGEQEKDTERE